VRATLAGRRGQVFTLVLLVIAGVSCKAYTGPMAGWVQDSLAGVVYVVFWSLAVRLLAPTASPARIALSVLAATCALEFMQLWHPPFLEYVRSLALGQILIGTTFSWWDFPHYVAGAGVGWLWMRRLRSAARKDPVAVR